jgi:UDP-N-acetylglucosamine 4,6-dehydratase
VIPFFLKCRADGVLPITDPRMTRFWITLEQGVNFVLKGLETMVGGELFVPKLPSMNIMDLARVIAPECKTDIIGIRPGEKLHEIMIPTGDARRTIEFADHYIIQPDFDFWGRRFTNNGGQAVPDEFEYNSGNNPWILTLEEMREIIRGLEA